MPETGQADNRTTFAAGVDTIAGDIRDWLGDRVREVKKPWTDLHEHEQRRFGADAERIGRDIAKKAVGLVASVGFDSVTVQVGKFTVKEGEIKAEFTCPATHDNLIAIMDAGRAALVLADSERFLGERAAFRVEPDQPEMFGEEPEVETDEVIEPEAGDVIHAGPPEETLQLARPAETAEGGIPLDQAEHLFEEANVKAAAKATRRRGKKAPETAPDQDALDAATARGRDDFLARKPGVVPDDIAGTPLAEAWLDGWDQASVASAKARDAAPAMPKTPVREPADA